MDMEYSEKAASKTVCVTGGSGFIASWLINFLLQRGYTIKASVRNPSDTRKIKHLYDLVGAKERLHLFQADLLEEGSFDAIVDGCRGVFHTASPCYFDCNDPQAELVEPAVKGTLNVLRSCAKTFSVKRVIVTSSTAAVVFAGKPLNPEVLVDETWFSDPKICEELKRWYALSKTLAEECAWKFAKDHKIDMITINPAMAIGPLLQPTLNLSSEAILKLINGTDTYSNYTYGWVNVRDVANAHILAFEIPSASGRYLLVERVAHISEILKTLRELYPDIQLPNNATFERERERAMGDLEVEKVVCVTGASGYIASWIVKLLLERGYTVKGSVRDPDDRAKTQHLHELPGANARLHLFKANLLDEGAFDSIVDGCVGVFHTASPCVFSVKDPQAELIDPAVKGTLNILSTCAKTPSIKRVIVTSSMATVAYNRNQQTPDTIIDENSFSDPEFLGELQLWYQLAKTLAEESAWKFAKAHNIDMVTINPGMVIGPLLQPTLNATTEFISSLFTGASTYPNLAIGWVDVRDVMKAHVLAFETASASGRYCMVERVSHFTEIILILRELYPGIQLPEKCRFIVLRIV